MKWLKRLCGDAAVGSERGLAQRCAHRWLPARVCVLALAWLIGCNAAKPPQPESAGTSSQPRSLRVLVIEDSELARAMEREWGSLGGDPITVREVTQSEFVAQQQPRIACDVVVFPSPLLGDLARRDWLEPLSERELGDARFQRRDIWELIRLQETNWAGRMIAVPLGSPTPLILYRRDIFSRLGLQPPNSWAEYHALAQKLADPKLLADFAPREGAPWSGACEPLGPGWAAEQLLARAAPYARHRSQFSTLFDYNDMRPLISGPPFVRALDELAADARLYSREALDWTPAAARRSFCLGQCAVAITWPSAADSGQPAAEPGSMDVGFAPLPGSTEVYNFRTATWEGRIADESPRVPLLGVSGRLAAITKECRNLAGATNLLWFLSGSELGVRVTAASKHTTLFRESQLAECDKWVDPQFGKDGAQRYAETVQAIFQGNTCLTTLRIPARHQYMSALDTAIRGVLRGEKSAAVALSEVARQWDEITDSLGREAQRRAYVQSIGLEP